jgi:DNA-binding transcriptional ArsR family regulator
MTEDQAIEALGAIAQSHRMRMLKLLMRAGPSGLSAGQIGERLDLAPSKVSFHIAQLDRAGLLRSWRVQRHIYYAVEIEGMRALLAYLTEDCCGGNPAICGGLVDAARLTDIAGETGR